MKLIITFCMGFFLSSNFAFAQSVIKDYYVNLKNDTIYGEFASLANGRIKFKVDGKKLTLDPKETYRVYNSEKSKLYAATYIQKCLVKIEGSDPKMYKISERLRKIEKPLFAEVVTDGEIVVYNFDVKQFVGSGGMVGMGVGGFNSMHTSDQFYALKKSSNEILELRKTGPILYFNVSVSKISKNLDAFFDGNSEILDAIEKEPKIKYEFLLEQIKKYNAWKELIGEGAERYGTQVF